MMPLNLRVDALASVEAKYALVLCDSLSLCVGLRIKVLYKPSK